MERKMKTLFILIAVCCLVFSLSGCFGSDSLLVELIWSEGDLDLQVMEPDEVVYSVGTDTSNGIVSEDANSGGKESYTLFKEHAPGLYKFGFDQHLGLGETVQYKLKVKKNFFTKTYVGTASADEIGNDDVWVAAVNIK